MNKFNLFLSHVKSELVGGPGSFSIFAFCIAIQGFRFLLLMCGPHKDGQSLLTSPYLPPIPFIHSHNTKERQKELTSSFQEHSPEDSHINSIHPLAKNSHMTIYATRKDGKYKVSEKAIDPVQSRELFA